MTTTELLRKIYVEENVRQMDSEAKFSIMSFSLMSATVDLHNAHPAMAEEKAARLSYILLKQWVVTQRMIGGDVLKTVISEVGCMRSLARLIPRIAAGLADCDSTIPEALSVLIHGHFGGSYEVMIEAVQEYMERRDVE